MAELEKELEILSKKEMSVCRGGGDGSRTNPYTWDEYDTLVDNPYFKRGWVMDTDGSLFYGLSSVTVTGGTEEHWKKKGAYDMNNCYACVCGKLAKSDQGDPKSGIYFGQLLAHKKYHRNDYYRYYGECD